MFGRTVQMVTIPPVVVNAPQASATQIDPGAVQAALDQRADAGQKLLDARRVLFAKEAACRDAYNGVYIRESGPEHLRKAVAEDRSSAERAERDAAELDRLAAEEAVAMAYFRYRAAMAGAAAPEAGES